MGFTTRGLGFLAAVAVLALGALVMACGDDDSDAAPGATGEVTATVSGDTTSAPPGAPTDVPGTGQPGIPPAFDQPPGTTASANGETVEMGIGTYCWTLMCVDKIGVPTRGTLTVSRGDFVTVAVPAGTPPLREVSAGAFVAQNSMTLEDGSEIWPFGGPPETPLGFAASGQTVEVEVDLDAGTYVLALSMYFEAGDVMYGVLLEVE